MDKFIPTNNYQSYYPLLWKALEQTQGTVVEMGMGEDSTELLHNYCNINDRFLLSYETNYDWHKKYIHLLNHTHHIFLIPEDKWDLCKRTNLCPSVLFIDHAPGERRKEDLLLFKDAAEIIVIHDTEPDGLGDYRVRPLFGQFKYVVEVQAIPTGKDEAHPWATALSNTIDITKWTGEVFGEYKIE